MDKNMVIKQWIRTRLSHSYQINTTSGHITTESTAPTFNAHPSCITKFAELEKNINEINENIEQLKISVSLNNDDKEMFAVLEERVINLENLVDNQSRADDEERDKFESTIDNLSTAIGSLNADLSVLRQKVVGREQSQIQIRLTTECIEDIQSHNLAAAEEKLSSIEDENKVNLIVHQVYNYQVANFCLILEFGDNIKDTSRRFLVYKALNYEMASNGHRDPSKMIRLIESFKNLPIINLPDIKQVVECIINKIKDSIRAFVKEKLKDGMLNDRYASVVDLAKTIYDFDEEMFKELIGEIINEVYGRISIENLLNSIPKEPRYVEQAVATYFAILDTMRGHGEFNTNAVFKVAYHVKNVIESDNPNFFNLKCRFPESVRNAVFAWKVCIKNVTRNEYIYSARMWGKTYDKERGYVYTWIPGNRVIEGDWLIEPDGDNFYIKNYSRHEYIYSARPRGKKFNNDRGYVFTWIPGNREPEALWKIEPHGDNCFIKNVRRNEYLYSARMNGQTFDKDRGYVFTWIPGNRVREAEWKIEDSS